MENNQVHEHEQGTATGTVPPASAKKTVTITDGAVEYAKKRLASRIAKSPKNSACRR